MLVGMSQEKLGDALGLTFQQVQKYEKGTNRIGASRLQQIAKVLGVPVSFFFEDAPRRTPAAGRLRRSAGPRLCRRLPVDLRRACSSTSAFVRIKDRKVRRRIIDLVDALGRHERTRPSAEAWTLERVPRRSGLTARALRCTRTPRSRSPARPPSFHGASAWLARTICSPANPCPKAIPTRSATASPTRSSICSSERQSGRDACEVARRLRDAGHHQPRRHRRRDARRPTAVTQGQARRRRARTAIKRHRLRAGRLPLEEAPRSKCCCTPSRPTSPRASTPPATRTKARATRASCSAMPAARRRS